MKFDYKILQIVDSLEIGGTERMSVNIYNTLTKKNINNYLVVSRKTGPLFKFIENKKNVFFLNKKSFIDFFSFFKLYKLILDYKPSIIHVHQTSIYWIFIVKLLNPKLAIIWHDHWGYSDMLKDSDRKIVKRLSFLMNGVICVNEKIMNWNKKNLKLKSDLITYIPNFPLVNVSKKKTNKTPTILCLANIREQKDHINLIKACNILVEQKFDFNLILAGSVEDTNYVRKVTKAIDDYKLNEKVSILGPVTDVSNLLGRVDIGVLSSKSEGLPVALLEYGLAGIPVVCTDVGQCKEVLDDGNFGWLVPSKSPEKLAESIKYALSNPEVARLKANKLTNNIDKNYGYQSFIKKYFELITKIDSCR